MPQIIAVFQDDRLTTHRRGRVFVGTLDVEIDVLAGVLVALEQTAEDGHIVVKSGRAGAFPAGGFVALAGLAQNGDLGFGLFHLGLQLDGLHEVVAVALNGDVALGQRGRDGVLGVHDVCHKMSLLSLVDVDRHVQLLHRVHRRDVVGDDNGLFALALLHGDAFGVEILQRADGL